MHLWRRAHAHLRTLTVLLRMSLDADAFASPAFAGGLVALSLCESSSAHFTDAVLARQQKLTSLRLRSLPTAHVARAAPVSAAAVDALPCLAKLNVVGYDTLRTAAEFPRLAGSLALTHDDDWKH